MNSSPERAAEKLAKRGLNSWTVDPGLRWQTRFALGYYISSLQPLSYIVTARTCRLAHAFTVRIRGIAAQYFSALRPHCFGVLNSGSPGSLGREPINREHSHENNH